MTTYTAVNQIHHPKSNQLYITSPFNCHVAIDYIIDSKIAPSVVNQYPSGEAQETMDESVLG